MMYIPLFWPYMTPKIRKSVNNTLKTRWIGQGPKVDEFEKAIEKKFDRKYAVAVNSGSAALELAYELAGIKKGDEVIVTPYTCTATNIPLVRRGAKLKWADIRKDTLNIDFNDVLKKITNKTKAIVNVNMGGIQSYIHDDVYLAMDGRPIITDSAQGLGFTNGNYVIYSFQAIKHFTTGDGGILFCPDEKTYKKAKLLRWFGIDREEKKNNSWQAYKQREMTFDIEYAGFKYHMNDIAASMGIEGLKDYDHIIKYRKKLFLTYMDELKYVDDIDIIYGFSQSVYWLMTFLVERRDDFAKKLKKFGIETNMVHIRNDIYKIFGGKRQNLPVMNGVEEKYICLPLHTNMTVRNVKFICDVIKKGW